jgi:hypothetical protein
MFILGSIILFLICVNNILDEKPIEWLLPECKFKVLLLTISVSALVDGISSCEFK